MTDNRAFKKLIRDYMKQHGVSYNKALKEVRLTTFNPSLASRISVEALKQIQDKPYGMILIVGASGTGKTSLLGDIQRFYLDPHNPKERRVINISTQEVAEEPLLSDSKNFISFSTARIPNGYSVVETSPTAWMIRQAVRMRPDVMTFDDIRTTDAADGMSFSGVTGHLAVSTIHGSKPSDGIIRLRALMDSERTDYGLGRIIDLIIHTRRDGNGFHADAYKYDSEIHEVFKTGDMDLFEEKLQEKKL